jgi:esterase/lipase
MTIRIAAVEANHRHLFGDATSPRRERHQHWSYLAHAARYSGCVGGFLLALLIAAAAQDIRGLEICTAEKQMERRTSCLQANVEFLQQALSKFTHETQDKMATASRDLAAAQAEIAELKSVVARLNAELVQLKAKAEPSGKK